MIGDLELAAALCMAAGDKSDGPARNMAYHLGRAIRALASPASPSRPVEAVPVAWRTRGMDALSRWQPWQYVRSQSSAEAWMRDPSFKNGRREVEPLYASPPPREPEGMDAATVEVKPLEWQGPFAHTDLGLYYYLRHERTSGVELERHQGSATTYSWFRTDDEAQAAAQTDYEARIRSAIRSKGGE